MTESPRQLALADYRPVPALRVAETRVERPAVRAIDVHNHLRTTFIGAHVACCAEDLAWVARMLDAYPNLHLDFSQRIAELGRQPRAARRLFVEHADRVLFGTDVLPPHRDAYETYFRFLETDDEHFAYSSDPDDPWPQGRWRISGLDLPPEALAAIYRENAVRLLGL